MESKTLSSKWIPYNYIHIYIYIYMYVYIYLGIWVLGNFISVDILFLIAFLSLVVCIVVNNN